MGFEALGGFGVQHNTNSALKTLTTSELQKQTNINFTPIGLNKEDPEKLFSFMLISMMRGALIFGGFYPPDPKKNDGIPAGGHALLATGLTMNDPNANGTFDPGESPVLTFIDPINPATQYTPNRGNFIADLDAFNKVEPVSGKANFIKAPITINTTNPNYLFAPADSSFNILSIDYNQGSVAAVNNRLPVGHPDRFQPPGSLTVVGGDTSNGRVSNQLGSNPTQMNIALAMSLHTKDLPFGLDNTVSTNPANTPSLYNLSSLIGTYDTVTGYLYTNESSHYSNSLSFYSVLDATGLIEDPISGNRLNPGDHGYLAAAKALADEFDARITSNSSQTSVTTKVINFERQSADIAQLDQFTLDLNGLRGGFLAPMVTTSAGYTWVPFAEANSDGQQHFKNAGIGGWRVEDAFNLGDRDFNDIHTQLIITNVT